MQAADISPFGGTRAAGQILTLKGGTKNPPSRLAGRRMILEMKLNEPARFSNPAPTRCRRGRAPDMPC
jgi:hypothetical protein